MRPSFYYEGHYQEVASKIKAYINTSQDFLSLQTADSPRAVGDALESLVAEKLEIETRHLGLIPGAWTARTLERIGRMPLPFICPLPFSPHQYSTWPFDLTTHPAPCG